VNTIFTSIKQQTMHGLTRVGQWATAKITDAAHGYVQETKQVITQKIKDVAIGTLEAVKEKVTEIGTSQTL
jgi:hypothetical protein